MENEIGSANYNDTNYTEILKCLKDAEYAANMAHNHMISYYAKAPTPEEVLNAIEKEGKKYDSDSGKYLEDLSNENIATLKRNYYYGYRNAYNDVSTVSSKTGNIGTNINVISNSVQDINTAADDFDNKKLFVPPDNPTPPDDTPITEPEVPVDFGDGDNTEDNGDSEKPTVNIDLNGDGIPDLNIDLDGDGIADLNIDLNGDGKPDLNIDLDGDGIADLNIDKNGDGKPDLNIDTDGDGKADLNIDKNGDGRPDLNIDTNGDGKADLNIDKNGDGKPDLNIDTDGDGKADLNIDKNGDGKPDLNIDTNGDGKADLNIDKNGDGKPDLNIDNDGDGKADLNIDINGDGKPDMNIDTNGDGIPDVNVDTNGDGIPDVNIDTNGDGIPDVNVDTDGDGDPDVNVDTNGDGIPDLNVDTDGDGEPDVNVDTNGDGVPDINIDTDGDGTPDANIDTNGDGIPDENILSIDISNGGWIGGLFGDGMQNFDKPDTGLSGYDIPGGPTDKYAANPFGLNFGDDSVVSSGVAIAGMVGLGAAAANAASTLTDKAKFSEGERDYDDDAKMSPEEYKKKKIKTIISCVLLGILLVGNLIALIIPSTTSLSILLLGVAIAVTAIITSMGIKFGKLFTLCATLANVLIIFIISCFGVIPVFGYFIAFVIVSAVFLYYYFKDIFAKVLPRFDFVPAVVALVVIGFVGFFTLIGFLVWWLAIILVILTIGGYFAYNYYGFAEKEAEREKQSNISFMDYIESISKSSKSNEKDTKNKAGNNKSISNNNKTGAVPGKTNKYVNDGVNKPMDGAPRVTEIDKFIAKLNGEEIKEETQEDVIKKHTSQNKINNNVADLFGNGNNFGKKSSKTDIELPKPNNNNNSGKNKFFN